MARMTIRRRPVEVKDLAAMPPVRSAPRANSRGLLLSNQTHRSPSDGVDAVFSVGVARLFKKAPGVGAFLLRFMGHYALGTAMAWWWPVG